jgi:hypothetical protein
MWSRRITRSNSGASTPSRFIHASAGAFPTPPDADSWSTRSSERRVVATLDAPAEQLVDVEALEVTEARETRPGGARRFEQRVQKVRARFELLHGEVARLVRDRDVVTPREPFDEGARVRLLQPFEVELAEAVECGGLRGAVEQIQQAPARAGDDEVRARLRGGLRHERRERGLAAQTFGEVKVVEQDDGADAARGRLLRRSEAQAHERALVRLALRALEILNQPLDPLVILRRGQLKQRAHRRRGRDERGVVAAVRHHLREERLQEAARGGRDRGVRAREGEVDGRGAAPLSEQLVEGLPEEFGQTRLRGREQEDARVRRPRRAERGYLAQLLAAPDEAVGRGARQHAPLFWRLHGHRVRL